MTIRLPIRVLVMGICLSGGRSLLGADPSGPIADESARAFHVLNRLAYGAAPWDWSRTQQIGIRAYIEEQLNPAAIDESANTRLQEKEAALFTERIRARESLWVAAGELWRYQKGTAEPDPAWNQVAFDDASWLRGPTGIGFGDRDDRTILDDMRRIADDPATPANEGQPGYLCVYLRRRFALSAEALAALDGLILRVDYDDGFRAYLNGTEVARANLPAGNVPYDRAATAGHEAGTPVDFEVTTYKSLLRVGDNVLAIQVHNQSLTSGDLSMIPELLNRQVLPGPPLREIRGLDALQQLVHIRGLYSRRQLQTVLAEFWENHFTTDYDKLVDYLDGLANSDATDAMTRAQAQAEAAQLEYQEYQFFYDHALGYFGDLLLHSATSPTMLVYLDNLLNVKGSPNENYAREILELHTFGVDNRYTQTDIEQLAGCFTGWSICKVAPEDALPFPASALTPPAEGGARYQDTILLDLGTDWKYFRGTREPTRGPDGAPTTAWTDPNFDEAGWLTGPTGIGYGDGDDATVLSDMQGRYVSVYLRRKFILRTPEHLLNPILEVAYDDGFVAYLNGMEVARSQTMSNRGNPPAHDRTSGKHEVSAGVQTFSLKGFQDLLRPGANVLAIQVHNTSLGSSDLSILPRLLDRAPLPGSVENGDRNGVWTFHLRAEEHDTAAKVLFQNTPYEIAVPAGRQGQDGLLDAVEVIEAMVRHPSTAEFICIKLIQKFVSDEISVATYKDATAPAPLRALLQDAIAAWNSTDPPGDIVVVMRAILDPAGRSNAFWSERAYRGKVKTAIEYINSSLRALDADASGRGLAGRNADMGMELFRRDDPDGYPEVGSKWIDTSTMLARIEFVTELAENRNAAYRWDLMALVDEARLRTPEQIVDFFAELLFHGSLSPANRELLLQYLSTDESGAAVPLNVRNAAPFEQRVRGLVGLMLSLPQWHYQ